MCASMVSNLLCQFLGGGLGGFLFQRGLRGGEAEAANQESVSRLVFQGFEREHIATQQEEPRDLLTQAAVRPLR